MTSTSSTSSTRATEVLDAHIIRIRPYIPAIHAICSDLGLDRLELKARFAQWLLHVDTTNHLTDGWARSQHMDETWNALCYAVFVTGPYMT